MSSSLHCNRRPLLRRLSASIGVVASFGGIACGHRAPESVPAPQPTRTAQAPRLSSEQLSQPAVVRSTTVVDSVVVSSAPEPRITLNTGDRDIDVKQALELIADRGGYSLAISPNLKSRVRLHLVDVPVSDALEAVLREANLTLTPATGVQVTWNPTVVFYQLPVNIDSLSTEAIMKRFNVSRDVAEMLVKARQ